MITKNYTKGMETIYGKLTNASTLSQFLATKTAKEQYMIIASVLAEIHGEGQTLVRGWYDVVGTLYENIIKFGADAYPLTDKQREWVSRELSTQWNMAKL